VTDMKITDCVPLPGQGVVARQGDLVIVTEGEGPGPAPLLGALESVNADAGDGAALVLAAARALLANPGQPSCACAGITAGGELAVLVHGGAVVVIGVDGAREVELTAGGSMLPVNRTFGGTTITVRITTGSSGVLNPRFRLDGGVVCGGGLVVTASADASGASMMMAEPGSWAAAQRVAGSTISTIPMTGDAIADALAGPVIPEVAPPPELSGPDGLGPPTYIVPSPGPTVPSREPRLHTPDPAAGFESISLLLPPAEPDTGDHPYDPASEVAPDLGPERTGAPDQYVPEPALVEGVLCARNHFNDPDVRYCRQCGISMVQLTSRVQQGQRPPLGVLLLDDGTGFTLDMDYVLGREPVLDGDVAAGRARPLRITDPDGTVSRLHLRISLVGWQVEVRDLGSVNGSLLYLPGGERKLDPYDSTTIEPGTRIGIGHRSIQYLSYRAG
jgi:FHA domain